MERIEKTRKLFKTIQYVGMGIIILAGIVLIWIFGINNSTEYQMSNILTYGMFTVMAIFIFVAFVNVPMQSKLL